MEEPALFLCQALIRKYKIMELGFVMENMSNSFFFFFKKRDIFNLFAPE